MKYIKTLLVFGLAASPALVLADGWVAEQGLSHLCGGVGDESQSQMKTEESASDAQLVLTAGPDRAYLSDVKLTVTSTDKQHSTSWQAQGPICLLKLPQGNYTINATYGDEHRATELNIKSGKTGNSPPLIINFKPS